MPLIQSTLAEALGVSRIPVREALHQLASEGLVTFTDDGAQVTVLAPAEIHELWTLRALIESGMAEAVIRKIQPTEVSELKRLVDQIDAATDGDEWSELNYEFHAKLYRAARLPHFARIASRLLTQIEPYSRVAVKRPEGRPAAEHEHHEMIAAIESSDADQLAEVLRRHSERARDLLLDLSSKGASSEIETTAKAAQALASRVMDLNGNTATTSRRQT